MSSKGFISLGFLLIAAELLIFLQPTAARFENCDYYEELSAQKDYYITSPGYPNRYKSGTSCRFVARAPSDYQISVQCDINIDQGSNGCSTELFMIDRTGNKELNSADYFCGNGWIPRTSKFRNIAVAYTSSSSTHSGVFMCLVRAIWPQ